MDTHILQNKVTSLADGELTAEAAQEVKGLISSDEKLAFHYEVQLIISQSLKTALIKHPVSFKLHKKLIKLSKQG